MLLRSLGNRLVETPNRFQGDPQLRDERLHEKGLGHNNALVTCECRGAFHGLKPLVDALLTVDVMLTKEARQGATPSQLGGFERRPLTEKVAKELRLLLGEPLEYLRNRGLSCAGQAMCDSDAVRHQPSTVCNQRREGAHLWPLGRQWLERIPVPQ